MKWPQGWREVPFQPALGQVVRGVTFSREVASDEPIPDGIPVLRAGNIQDRLITDQDLVWIPKSFVSHEQVLQKGDVVVCTSSGSAHLVGKAALLDHEFYGTFGAFNAVMRCDASVLLPEYLHLWMVSPLFDQWRSRLVAGANIQNIRQSDLAALRIVVPPLPEQQRIVEVLHAADALRQAKQRVLQGFDEVIQAQYRAQFGRYFTRQGLLNATRIGEHVESTQYGVSEAMAEAGSHAVLRMNSITSSGWLDLSDLKYANLSSQDAAATTLQDGDLLFNRTNSRELVGKCAIWRGEPERYSFASYLVRLRLKPTLLPEYLWATLNSPYGKYRLFNAAKQAVSMANVSPTDLARISIPLPPVEEQSLFAAFVREVERQRGQISVSGARMQTLQPALITEALSGRLTAAWREQHAQALAEAARERDARLGAPAPRVTVRITEHAPTERRTDLARPRRQAVIEQLSSFQHEVWNTLRFEWRGAVLADDPAAFEEFCTSPQTAWRLEGFAAGREAVRRALEQLAAMGLIRKMSLPRPNPNTGRTEYLTAFRPLREAEDGSRPEEDTALADAERLGRELERRRAPEAR